ncbi:cytochrome c biogenesis CcdA family protein [Blastococcus sp. Marseille-P5729]|uniref:cytochrome c biogenesis CcdA family protein n=1 Tax=Blastococcus sp. Marseille-P5729 TaxID=2086582 RepID=UPI000D102754|nr:cytochrome c biogenesis CcdA family protein [Blastococcus sp. Marseille-P5729]
MDIGLIGAFLGGILTLLSPCSAVLLPGFFAYAFSTTSALLGRTLVFYLGLLITLVPMGVAASALGSLVTEHRAALVAVMAALVIVLGAIQLLGINIPLPGRTVSHRRDARSTVSVLILGAVYGVAGVCSGPILGSVLAVAALGSNAVYGGIILAIYALGMAVPVFVLALLWDRFQLQRRAWLRPRPVQIGPISTTRTGIISGLLFIGIGVLLLLTDGTGSLGGVLPIETQFALEARLSRWASSIPSYVGAALLVLIATAIAFVLAGRRRPDRSADPD